MQNIKLTLIGTSHCHLCEHAMLIVEDAIKTIEMKDDKVLMLSQVDIIDNTQLYELYATKIPVLKIEEKGIYKILLWPFSKLDVMYIINSVLK